MRGETADPLYGPMVDVLRERFGVTFELWDTGGGCQALVGEFEGDITVIITDAPSSIHGQELQITDQPTRDQFDRQPSWDAMFGDSTVGFAVGVYRDEQRTNLAYGEYPQARTAQLPDLVSDQLVAAKGKP